MAQVQHGGCGGPGAEAVTVDLCPLPDSGSAHGDWQVRPHQHTDHILGLLASRSREKRVLQKPSLSCFNPVGCVICSGTQEHHPTVDSGLLAISVLCRMTWAHRGFNNQSAGHSNSQMNMQIPTKAVQVSMHCTSRNPSLHVSGDCFCKGCAGCVGSTLFAWLLSDC